MLVLALAAGLRSGSWNVSRSVSTRSLDVVGSLLRFAALAVSAIAVPIVLARSYGLVAPAALLVVVALAWIGYGAAMGSLWTPAAFGLGLSAVGLVPAYLGAYPVLGSVECLVRSRSRPA